MDTPGITSPLLPSKRRLFLQSAAASSMLTVIGKGWRNAHAQAKIQFPFPHYLPSGFSLQEQVSKPASGFGGDPELGLIYSKPGRDPVTHANWPLVLIASLNPTRP